jgi:photosystem II stability/assembly factor-like uncharacterized protein
MTSCWQSIFLGLSFLGLNGLTPVHAQCDGSAANPPQAEINNGVLKVHFHLPDAKTGFYRGTRFDWSGVIGNLEYHGHRYYGPWFTKTDPTVTDFVYQGADIVAGPCSAITGPVEEFSTDDKALGYDEAKPSGTFIKIGVGVLRKPRDGGSYNRFRLYEIVDPGTWKVKTTRNSIEFTHNLADPSSGYGYRYQKTIQLVPGRPEMVMDHKLLNMGKRSIASSVYNHNFLVLDGQPPGPDFVLKMPFEIKTKRAPNNALAEVRGNQVVFLKTLRAKETVFTQFQGFGPTAADYRFTIENKKTRAGLKITGDRPLSAVALWSIRSVLSLEPFIAMTIEPGQEFTWKYTYTYYVTGGNEKWQTQTIDTKADFRGLSVVSPNVAWVSGTKGTFARTTDGGKTWSVGTVLGAEKFDFRDVEAFGENTAYLLSAGPGDASRIYKTVDGGKSWAMQFKSADPAAFFDAIAYWDEHNGIALGDPIKGQFQLMVTADGGGNWKPLEAKTFPPALPDEGAFAASGTCLITHGESDVWFATGGAKSARVFHSKDRGQNWEVSETPITAGVESAGIFSIAFRDKQQGMIVGGDYRKPNETGATAAITYDGGKTWRLLDKRLPFCSAVAWAKDRWVAVGTTGSHVSLDDGATWNVLDRENYNSVGFTSTGDGWAVGPKGRIAKLVR